MEDLYLFQVLYLGTELILNLGIIFNKSSKHTPRTYQMIFPVVDGASNSFLFRWSWVQFVSDHDTAVFYI